MMRYWQNSTVKYAVLVVALILVSIAALSLLSAPVSGSKQNITVFVLKGSTAGQIAQSLVDQHLIRSKPAFLFLCRVSGAGESLKPGVYKISQNMSTPQIITKLTIGKPLEVWFTIPEGYNIRQMADVLAADRLADPEAFIASAIGRSYDYPQFIFLHGTSLEGYLFPDTYLMNRGVSTQGIIVKILETFDSKVVKPYSLQIQETSAKRFGYDESQFDLGLYKILILASIVEREARVPKDRALIAAVLWNRLAKNMRLEVDATCNYIPGKSRQNKSKMSISDTRVDSAYNTYTHKGLPPGPICSPGLASIKAVLEPAEVNYLYYVAKADGSHVFTSTFEEHKAAKAQIKKARG